MHGQVARTQALGIGLPLCVIIQRTDGLQYRHATPERAQIRRLWIADGKGRGVDNQAGIGLIQPVLNLSQASRFLEAGHGNRQRIKALGLQALAEHIAHIILNEFGSPWVKLSVAKLGMLRGVKRVGVTIERGKLWMLQTRSGKRTAKAALKTAVDMANEGLITQEEAVARVVRSVPGFVDHVLVVDDASRDGTYRQALNYRHRYRDALVQIANELAGDCDDFAILVSAMIEAIGGRTRVVIMDEISARNSSRA